MSCQITMSPYSISVYACLYMKKGPTIMETAVSPRTHVCAYIKPSNMHIKKVWGILVWHTHETHHSSCDSTNHTPSTINCTPSPTPCNTSNLYKNTEQRSYDAFSVDWDLEDLASSSIHSKHTGLTQASYSSMYGHFGQQIRLAYIAQVR